MALKFDKNNKKIKCLHINCTEDNIFYKGPKKDYDQKTGLLHENKLTIDHKDHYWMDTYGEPYTIIWNNKTNKGKFETGNWEKFKKLEKMNYYKEKYDTPRKFNSPFGVYTVDQLRQLDIYDIYKRMIILENMGWSTKKLHAVAKKYKIPNYTKLDQLQLHLLVGEKIMEDKKSKRVEQIKNLIKKIRQNELLQGKI